MRSNCPPGRGAPWDTSHGGSFSDEDCPPLRTPEGGLGLVGTLQYDGVLVEFEDRLLAHLQIVIVQKIRRGESFLMSWRDAPETGDGHSAIWVHPAQNLYFKFAGSKVPSINQE